MPKPPRTGVLVIRQIKSFVRKEPVLTAAGILAFITIFIIPPDKEYIKYIDFKTLLCLLSLMIALKSIECEGFIAVVSAKLSSKLNKLRNLTFFLVFACFFSSMFMTNDVALIAFVPITLTILSACKIHKHAPLIIVLQTLAANIGSSLTPIGNPQNLFLFIKYGFEPIEFIMIMLPFILFGGILLTLSCLLLPDLSIRQKSPAVPAIRGWVAVVNIMMFLLAVTSIFGAFPYWIATIIIAAITFFIDKHTLVKVDYSLLLTFAVIFIFVGNIARIEWLNKLISEWVKMDTMLTALVSSQFISNVPAAVMLSGFSDNAPDLALGVNLGGMGTLIASMASVISYKLYAKMFPNGIKRYLIIFTVMNIIFLALFLVFIKFFVIK